VASITLKPNEYRVLATQPITFKYKVSVIEGTSTSRILVNEDRTSYYRIRFDPAPLNQTPVLLGMAPTDAANMDTSVLMTVSSDAQSKPYAITDRCSTILRRSVELSMAADKERQQMRGTPPGNATENPPGIFVNTTGDPRSAFYMPDMLTANAYDGNASLWGPTIRRRTVESNMLYYATYPARWPDRGHNLNVQQGINAGSQKKEPFHRDIVSNLPRVEPWHSTLAPMRISNAGRYFSVTELGNIHDPIFWDPKPGRTRESGQLTDTKGDQTPWKVFWDLGTKPDGSTEEPTVTPDARITGGNTLRIGRPEHRLFRSQLTGGKRLTRGMSASALVDLFHCGVSTVGATQAISGSQGNATVSGEQAAENLRDLTGPLSQVNGHVNLNTASRHVLRSLVTGTLVADAGRKDSSMTAWPAVRPPQNPVLSSTSSQADRLVDAIVRGRPYVSAAAVGDKAVDVTTVGGQVQSKPAFGVDKNHAGWVDGQSEWNDAATEEVFARLYNSSTVRSRNFRIFVTGQAIRARRSDPNQFDVLATRSKVYHVHIHPVRDPVTGMITRQRAEVTYEQDL
jgi:hypothetical protein